VRAAAEAGDRGLRFETQQRGGWALNGAGGRVGREKPPRGVRVCACGGGGGLGQEEERVEPPPQQTARTAAAKRIDGR
jgi:hypothetical protein